MKKINALLVCLMITQTTYTKNVTQISIPKTGTHLLRKCICSLTGVPANQVISATQANWPTFYHVEPSVFYANSKRIKHWINHLFFNKEFEPFLNNDKTAFFFMYRDPRDQVVSFAHYRSKSKTVSFDDHLMKFIQSSDIYRNHPPCDNIDDLYQHYMPWFSAPHVCIIRFEDLIGPKGGGNLKAQLETIKKIANHLGIVVTDKQIQTITNTLFW